ncbi:MAG: 5'/3'-nucleotidase SurE [Bacteroidota bacterium]|nr:5'/3'-nucleotidase SurE [Bacteroidota bacterium]
MTSESTRPLILVTNDDGITAPGIRNLVESIVDLGDVVVVAPDSHQSGMGHAITISNILRMSPHDFGVPSVQAYKTTGTPVDCVKLAIYKILERKPDVLVSGINHGSNASINVIYSGTMSAAVEGALEGISSVGFSLCDFAEDADFSASRNVARTVTQKVLKHGTPTGTCLNVNIPKVAPEDLRGIKVCRQGAGHWADSFEEREAPGGRTYYWMTGNFTDVDKGEDTDEWALKHGYVSVVPVQYDMTAHHAMTELNQWDLNGER